MNIKIRLHIKVKDIQIIATRRRNIQIKHLVIDKVDMDAGIPAIYVTGSCSVVAAHALFA